MESAVSSVPINVLKDLSHGVLACAIEVHRNLGPGLLESVYNRCLFVELSEAGFAVQQEVPIPVQYKHHVLDTGFRADLVVEDKLLLELKSIERLLPIHEAQVLTYLRLAKLRLGLLINFNCNPLKNGIRRFVK
ncbi:MAG: GxxExxY protein [Pseudomonadota bacterium]|nr:GxxExxY protein [Pseudomonadota bacterium]